LPFTCPQEEYQGTHPESMEINVKKRRGTLAKGFASDIIATPENPLQNLQALRKVMLVMKNGKIFRHDKSTIRQTLEEQNN